MAKWRTVQNLLAWIIAIEMIAALTCTVYYALLVGAGTESFLRFGNSAYAANIGSLATFIGLVLLFLFREPITAWVMRWAVIMQSHKDAEEDDEDDE